MRHRTITVTLTAALLAAALAIPQSATALPTVGQSRFGRMFPAADHPATIQELADLAQVMFDPNADADNNPSGLTSAFTYFGQFVDHDLTLDTSPSPTATVDPATLVNNRAFSFDLDTVYGGGPDVSPQLYQADRKRFLVQTPNANGVNDLPRRPDGSAILVEGRNDENQIISQIHTAFLLFHNRMVDRFRTYEAAHVFTVMAYRWIVLHEFLPDIVGQDAIDAVPPVPAQGFYDPGSAATPTTPVEFSVAAYRFGHSQVRRAYRLNGNGNCANLQVFNLANPTASLMGGRPLQTGRQINWGQFLTDLPQPPECAALVVAPPAAAATSAARSTGSSPHRCSSCPSPAPKPPAATSSGSATWSGAASMTSRRVRMSPAPWASPRSSGRICCQR